ncbi:MAG: hypothetical protein KME03_18560 [Aphanocapsa lilacina HA4352-LM1]|jgi:hypothetical protein|nr:hypothetical protein [Aphanocapsa lilacina HA4352-LM1]
MHKKLCVCAFTLLTPLAIAGAWRPPLPAAAQSGPTDVLVSGPSEVVDPEFDQQFARFTWNDDQGNVWIGKVDPATGDFLPPAGNNILVDTGAVPVAVSGNGPEWVYTAAGPQIVYTKYGTNGRIAVARARENGSVWSGGIIEDGENRTFPIGSQDRRDPAPRLSYVGRNSAGKQVTLWRELDNAASEAEVPNALPPGGRWVPGRRELVFIGKAGRSRQAFRYDVDSRQLEQLTDDTGQKFNILMWQAPEFDNEYVFFTLTDETSIGVYRQIEGTWTKINTLKPPAAGRYIWSPEVFVHNGKSYIFMVTSTSRDQNSRTVPTDIWMAGIEPDAPFYRQVSDTTLKVRKDPEVFITTQGPYIYYLALPDPQTSTIYRADTGLGAAR